MMTTQLELSLLEGLLPERIEYRYQPLYNTETKQIDKAEVLLRVQDGMGGYFDTEELVTVAEEMGLIDEMDHQTFIHACGILPTCKKKGISGLSVNLSPSACHASRLIPEVRRIMAETGTDPASICLEITEIAKLIDEEPLFETMRALNDMGVMVAMDDFGKGYSNLQRMVSMPFQILKLDKSLVWAMENGGIARALLESMVHFAGGNRISVIAEGIETAAQAQIMQEMGCHYLQGYYYGKPMPLEDLFAVAEDYQNRSRSNRLA